MALTRFDALPLFLGSILWACGCHGAAETSAAQPSGAPAPATPTPMPSRDPAPPVVLAPGVYDASPAPKLDPMPTPSEPASPNGSAMKTRYVVAAIGDSLTDTRAGGGRYLRYLQERCPESRFDSYGKGGDMVNQMRRRFETDVLGKVPDDSRPAYTDVIVFGGVNDLYSDLTAGRTVAKIEADLTAMYRTARAHRMRVIAVTVTPWGGFHRYFTEARAATTAELNRWLRSQPASKIVDRTIDAYPLLACGQELCPKYQTPFRDGLHFGPEGHRRLADALYREAFPDCR